MRLRHVIPALAFVALLGACQVPSTTQQTLQQELTSEELAQLRTERPDLMLAVYTEEIKELTARANIYAAQQWCTEEIIVMCADPEVVVIIDDLAKAAERAHQTAQAFAAASQGTANPVALATLRLALAQLQHALVARGI